MINRDIPITEEGLRRAGIYFDCEFVCNDHSSICIYKLSDDSLIYCNLTENLGAGGCGIVTDTVKTYSDINRFLTRHNVSAIIFPLPTMLNGFKEEKKDALYTWTGMFGDKVIVSMIGLQSAVCNIKTLGHSERCYVSSINDLVKFLEDNDMLREIWGDWVD